LIEPVSTPAAAGAIQADLWSSLVIWLVCGHKNNQDQGVCEQERPSASLLVGSNSKTPIGEDQHYSPS
ncbi:MAG TPA: hypothetical protein VFS89_09685, partial [Nitrosospira sp.]|nr:hypothetical protein [Nitrosospira sp.]